MSPVGLCIYLNTWCPVDGVFGEVMGLLGHAALLEEVHHHRWTLCGIDVISQLPAQDTCSYAFLTIMDSHSGTANQNKLKSPSAMVFYYSNQK